MMQILVVIVNVLVYSVLFWIIINKANKNTDRKLIVVIERTRQKIEELEQKIENLEKRILEIDNSK